MKRALLLVAAQALACSADLTLDDPGALVITCGSDAECPTPLLCQVSIATCVTELDESAPTVVSTQAVSAEMMAISFSEAMSTTATPVTIDGLTVASTVWTSDARTLSIFTSHQTAGADYRVVLLGFGDRVGNPLAPPTSVQVAGFTPVTDRAPPDPITPADHAGLFAADGAVLFGWTARAGATTYSLEISRSPAFDVLEGSPHVVAAPEVSLAVDGLPADATLYWRVTSDVTTGELVRRDFDVRGDVLYVRCSDTDDCGATTVVQNGTSTRPFRRINDAVVAALAFASQHASALEVRVASRAAGYQESVAIVGGPLRLLGGYAEDFATRDIDTGRTLVSNLDAALRVTSVTTQPVLIEGFYWHGGGLLGSTAAVLKQVSSVDIQHCTFHVNAIAGGVATALVIANGVGPGPRLDDVDVIGQPLPTAASITGVSVASGCFRGTALTVSTGTAQRSVGLAIAGPSPCDTTLELSSVTSSGGIGDSIGISVNDGSIPAFGVLRTREVTALSGPADRSDALEILQRAGAVIERSTFHAAVATTFSRGVLAASDGPITIHDSVFLAGGTTGSTGSPQAVGGDFSEYDAELIGNTFVAGSSARSIAGSMTFGARYVLRNNIFATRDASGICVVTDDQAQMASFEANALLGCTSLYKVGNLTALTSEASVNALDDTASCAGCEPRRGLGNIAATGALTTFFVDPNGATGTLANDFVLLSTAATAYLRSVGKDPTALDCGTYASPQSCGGTLLDRAGTTRAAPFSIGAYEVP